MKFVPPSGIAVLESRWGKHWDISVSPFVHAACQAFDSGPLSFHYETVNSKVALEEALPRIAQMRHIKYVYLALHGTHRGLECFNGDVLSLETMQTDLASALTQRGATLAGLHIGACGFGTAGNLSNLLSAAPKLSWVSGYSTRADWIGSAALDMQIIYHLLGSLEAEHKGKIEDVAERLKGHAAGACKDFGLNIIARAAGSKTHNLMEIE